MNKRKFAIIEIGSNVTKVHVYDGDTTIWESKKTIKFKKNYYNDGKVSEEDLRDLYALIEETQTYTEEIHLYGCSIFRNLREEELAEINKQLQEKYNLKIEVVTQNDEANYTALGCYANITIDKTLCVYIGGGGSIELLFVKNGEVIDNKYYDFGVVDLTNQFPSLKEDIPTCTFDEVYAYVEEKVGDIKTKADILILAGGDHPYWYNCAGFELLPNTLYSAPKQEKMLTVDKSDEYDRESFKLSLDEIRNNSDEPNWFDGCRATKMMTNVLSHKISCEYLIPTNIGMEEGIKAKLLNEEN